MQVRREVPHGFQRVTFLWANHDGTPVLLDSCESDGRA
jgi:hypothetical protein